MFLYVRETERQVVDVCLYMRRDCVWKTVFVRQMGRCVRNRLGPYLYRQKQHFQFNLEKHFSFSMDRKTQNTVFAALIKSILFNSGMLYLPPKKKKKIIQKKMKTPKKRNFCVQRCEGTDVNVQPDDS